MGDKELQQAVTQSSALSQALSTTNEALNAAHLFVDIVTGDESESVLSEADAELASIVHDGILAVADTVAAIGAALAQALQAIDAMTPEEVQLIQAGANALPTASKDDDSDGPGFYL